MTTPDDQEFLRLVNVWALLDRIFSYITLGFAALVVLAAIIAVFF